MLNGADVKFKLVFIWFSPFLIYSLVLGCVKFRSNMVVLVYSVLNVSIIIIFRLRFGGIALVTFHFAR